MLWKILSALTAICLAVGLWFSYLDKHALEEERLLEQHSLQNLDSIKADKIKKTVSKEKRNKELEDYTKQRSDRQVEIAKVNSDITDKEKETEALKKTLEEAQKQLAMIKDQIEKAGDLKKLIAQVEDLTKQIKDSESAIANQQQQKAIVEEKLAATSAQVKKLQEVDTRQRSGQIQAGLSARVVQAYPGYGFVVLSKGNSSGIYANNLLDVRRGKTYIARLRVRDVELGQSVADVIPGTLAKGESVMTGDLAVATARPPEPVVPITKPSAPLVPPAGGAPLPVMPTEPLDSGTPPATPLVPQPSADPFAPPPAAAE